MKSVVHAVDERLRIHVAQKQWPLLDFRIAKKNQPQVYCGQAVTLNVEVENIGKELVNGFCMATDGLDCISVSLLDVNGKKLTVTVRAPASPDLESDIGLVFYYRGENLTYRQWQTVVSLCPVPLFQASAVLLDEVHGIAAINMRNVMPANDAALARCEVSRIRLVCQNVNEKGFWSEVDATNVSIQPMKVGQVQLDCEQSCNVCLRISVPTKAKPEEQDAHGVSWCLSPTPAEPPSWPAALPTALKTTDESQNALDNYYQLAILWRASVVNNDGHVSSIVGETFIDEPLTAAKLRFPRTDMWSSREGYSLHDDHFQNAVPDDASLNIICRPIRPIRHNFELNRLCQIPLEVLVTNVDDRKRSADLTLKYRPKVSEAVTSLTQLPPENRQQWWVDREVVRSVVKHGESHVFRFVISVCQPSVYDVAGSQLVLEATFDNAEVKTFKQLLAAEKRAAEKINEARKRKFQRMKQAKQEAQAEVEKYRQEREREFKQYEQTYLGTKEDTESKIRRDTENEIEAMKRNVAANKQQVIVRLLQLVCDIRPELHHNLILQKKLHGQFS
ncbi:V-type ATPase, G subunit [Teladorsagia circumcincta]|uniref:V-type ATPase, G subunit n=1 Tax=Teladorsagia circumcincta TaxID=45464 RepID=A0A2G9V2W4_TELCI|nr:V-type ATPase, G subunit [Teladorsagia circumcincta]